MTKELVSLLNLTVAENKLVKERIVKTLPKEMVAYDGNTYQRELLLSESVEKTGLIQTEIYNTVCEGAKYVTCFRDVVTKISMPTGTMNYPIGSGGIYASEVAEGAEFPSMYQDYSYKPLVAKKFGWKAAISEEIIADARFDLVNIELTKLGQGLENTFNRYFLDQLVPNAGLEQDTTGTAGAQGVLALVAAKAKVMDAGFYADKAVIHPEFWAKIMADYKPAYNEKGEETLRSGNVPTIVGLGSYICGVSATTLTNWDYDTDNDYGGLVLDSARGTVAGMTADITVKYAEDAFKMLVAPVAYMRFDGGIVNTNAVCKIKF
jgi:HK97 family phage major capsid protein